MTRISSVTTMANKPFADLFDTAAANFPDHGRSADHFNTELTGLYDDGLATCLISFRDAIPTVIAFLSAANGLVYFGHSPTLFHGLAENTKADLNYHCVVFVGNHTDTAVPFALDGNAFAEVNQRVIVNNLDHLGAYMAHRGANPGIQFMPEPVEQLNAGLANHTAEVSTSRVGLVPHTLARHILRRPVPTCTMAEFSNLVLVPLAAMPDPVGDFSNIFNWWKVATGDGVDGDCHMVSPGSRFDNQCI